MGWYQKNGDCRQQNRASTLSHCASSQKSEDSLTLEEGKRRHWADWICTGPAQLAVVTTLPGCPRAFPSIMPSSPCGRAQIQAQGTGNSLEVFSSSTGGNRHRWEQKQAPALGLPGDWTESVSQSLWHQKSYLMSERGSRKGLLQPPMESGAVEYFLSTLQWGDVGKWLRELWS